jgi:hypothetical protein
MNLKIWKLHFDLSARAACAPLLKRLGHELVKHACSRGGSPISTAVRTVGSVQQCQSRIDVQLPMSLACEKSLSNGKGRGSGSAGWIQVGPLWVHG